MPENKPIRASIADLMVICAQKIHDKNTLFDGLRLSFEAKPNLSRLSNLYEHCDATHRLAMMLKASAVVEMHLRKTHQYNDWKRWERDQIETPANPSKSLLLHTYLLSNENNKATNTVEPMIEQRF